MKTLAHGIALGLRYLHSHNIVHRDIKPENIVLTEDCIKDSVPQIVDFGFARKLDKKGSCSGVVGTIPYVAPEILKRAPYSYSCDVWSYGCLVYGLLSGDHPLLTTCHASFDDMRKVILKRDVRFDQLVWRKVTPECRDLLRNLLVKEPENRLNIDEVLSHPWFAD